MYYFFQYFPYVILMMLLEGLSPVLMAFRKPLMKARISCGALPLSRVSLQLGLGCLIYVFCGGLDFLELQLSCMVLQSSFRRVAGCVS